MDGPIMYCSHCNQFVVTYILEEYQWYYANGKHQYTISKSVVCPFCHQSHTLQVFENRV